jgi:hypothetical protein
MVKRKRILIILGTVIIVLFIGAIVYFFLRNPELLTKSPSEIILRDREQDYTNLKLDIGDEFIVRDSFWKNAKIYHQTYFGDGEGESIRFIDLPVGAKIYAPFDGYVYIYDVFGEGGSIDVVVLSNRDDWFWSDEPPLADEQTIVFISRGLETYEVGSKSIEEPETEYHFEINEREMLAGISENGKVVDDSNFIIEYYFKPSNLSVTNAKEYLRINMELNKK